MSKALPWRGSFHRTAECELHVQKMSPICAGHLRSHNCSTMLRKKQIRNARKTIEITTQAHAGRFYNHSFIALFAAWKKGTEWEGLILSGKLFVLTGVALFLSARRHVCNYIDGLLTSKTVAHKWFCDIRHAREIRYRQLQVFSGLKTMRNLMGNWVRFHPILSTARTIEPQKIDTSKTSCMLTASSECSFKVNLRVNCNRWIVNLSLQRRT